MRLEGARGGGSRVKLDFGPGNGVYWDSRGSSDGDDSVTFSDFFFFLFTAKS